MRKRSILKIAMLAVVFLFGLSINANAGFTTLSGTITNSANGSYLTGVLVTAYPTISCGSWTGAAGLTNRFGHYAMTVPDDCEFYIYPTRKNYVFDPEYYYVIPNIVNSDFDFIGTFN